VAVTPVGARRPTVVLDAGTGIRSVTTMLGGEPFVGTILLTHLHWDHFHGLPFFAAADRDDAKVRVGFPDQGLGDSAELILSRAMSPPVFPIGPDGLRGDWSFEQMAEGRHEIEGLDVLARAIPHKGGTTFGYRVSDATSSFAYLPDHLPAASGPTRAAAIDLCRDVDLLLHDAQFIESELDIARRYGHSTVEQAVAIAVEARVGELTLVHHGPGRTDPELRAILDGVSHAPLPVDVARQGVERGL
jgi:ribonuclease BN (tRNA processing enzyme)